MQRTIVLDDSHIPRAYYNIQADLPRPLDPPLHPGTGQPIGPQDLAAIFPMALIQQEVSKERFIEIPDEVLEEYRKFRPTPLVRATALEKALDTPAEIYYKYEGTSARQEATSSTPRWRRPTTTSGGGETSGHRDRRRPVGKCARARLQHVRAGVQGLHGEGEL